MTAREMEAHYIGGLVVTDDEEKMVGVIADRDSAMCLAHSGTAATTLEETMSRHVVTIPDEQGRAVGMVCRDHLYNYLTQETVTLVGAVRAQGEPQA